jgi:hypothetical protein
VAKGDGDNMDPAVAAELRRRLASVDDLWRRCEVAAHRPIEPRTRASADDALPDGRFVSLFASQALLSALDHLIAWRRLVEGGHIPIQAHMTLLRGALEGAVRCRWHVDGKVRAGTRVGRGFAARRDDQDERRKFEASREGGARLPQQTSGQSAVQRLDHLDDPEAVKVREAAEIQTVGFADSTSLMIKYRLERWYRLASAAAHGKEWVLAIAQLEPQTAASPRPGVSVGRISARDDVVLALTTVTIRAVGQAVGDLEAYTSPRLGGRHG